MAATSRASATTQITRSSRLGEAQMGQSPPSVRLRQMGQHVTFFFASTMASANSCASASVRLSTWNASRCALLPPMPGSRANCSTSFSSAAGKYSIPC